MADNKITFAIGSTFGNEGFKSLDTASKGAAQQAKKLGAVMQTAGAKISECDGTLGAVAGSIMSVVNGFSTMGVAGGVAAAGVVAVNLAFAKQKEEADKLVEKCKDINKAVTNAYNEAVKQRIDSVTAAIKSSKEEAGGAVTEFKSMVKMANELNAAASATQISAQKAELQNLKVEQFNAILETSGEAEKKVVKAAYDVEIALKEQESAVKNAAQDVDTARENEKNAEQRVKLAKEAEAAALEAYNTAKDAELDFENANAEDRAKAKAKADEAFQNLMKAQDEVIEAEKDSSIASQNLNTAINNEETARQAAALKVSEMKADYDDLKSAIAKEAEAREKAANEAEAKQMQYEGYESALADAQKSRDDASDSFQKRLAEVDKKIADADQTLADMTAGMAADQKYHRGISGQGYAYTTDANGIADFNEYQRSQRYKARADRDQANQDRYRKYQEGQMDKIRSDLEAGKYVSDSDRKKLEDYDKWQNARNKDALTEEKKSIQERMKDTLDKMDDNINTIKEKMEELGLK